MQEIAVSLSGDVGPTDILYYDSGAVNASGDVGAQACVQETLELSNQFCLGACQRYTGSNWYCTNPSYVVWPCVDTYYDMWSNETMNSNKEFSLWKTSTSTGYWCYSSNPTYCGAFCN
jgi:hypothetical protein